MANAHSSPHFRDRILRIHRISISPTLSPSRWHELPSQQPISLTLSPCYSVVCLPQFPFSKPSSTTPESFNKRSLKFATLNPWFEVVPAPIKPMWSQPHGLLPPFSECKVYTLPWLITKVHFPVQTHLHLLKFKASFTEISYLTWLMNPTPDHQLPLLPLTLNGIV